MGRRKLEVMASRTSRGGQRSGDRQSRQPGPRHLTAISQLLLVALSTLLAFQLVRVFLPLVFDLGERSGTTGGAIKAGLLALAASLAPLLAPLFIRLLGARRSLVVVLLAMTGVRLIVQLRHPVSLSLATLGMTISLLALSLLLIALTSEAGGAGGRTFVLGLMIGLALDTSLRGIYWTWDYAWQPGMVPLLLTLIPAAAVAYLATLERTGEQAWGDESARTTPRSLGSIGPFIFLQLLFLQNTAFVASSGQVSLPVATTVVLLGDAAAVLSAVRVDQFRWSTARKLIVGGSLVLLSFLLRGVRGPALVVVVVACQFLATGLLVMAMIGAPAERQRSLWSASTGLALGSFAFVLFLVLYQVVYRIRIPLPNTVLAPAAALLLALGGVRSRPPFVEKASNRLSSLAALPLALMLVPISVTLSRPTIRTEASSGSFVLLSYNVHLAIDHRAQLNPEALAEVIRQSNPDVVALQEVPRGWAGTGGIDLAAWLSNRLGMKYVFAPAADHQFGNVLMTRFRVLSSRSLPLPKVHSAMRRSYVRATLDLGNGRSVNVFDAHLEGGQPDHRDQVLALLREWGGAGRTLIAGDMNMQPGDRDGALFETRGLVSIQDQAGKASAPTATNPKSPGDRVDFIFGTTDLSYAGFTIGASSPSDHLPLSVQIGVR